MFIIFMSILAIFLLFSSISLYFNILKNFNKTIIRMRGFRFELSSKNYYKKLKLIGLNDFFILLWCLFLIVIEFIFKDNITNDVKVLISIVLILSVIIDNYIFSIFLKKYRS